MRTECDLCEAARITPWYYEDELCWVAECEVCATPMVVWKDHGPTPPEEEKTMMLSRLQSVAEELLGVDGFRIDAVMRQIPDHFHAHARRPSPWLR